MARPRKHPDGTTASDRKRMALATRLAAGDMRIDVLISAEAANAMTAVIDRTGETKAGIIERLILQEAGRGRRPKRKTPAPAEAETGADGFGSKSEGVTGLLRDGVRLVS